MKVSFPVWFDYDLGEESTEEGWYLKVLHVSAMVSVPEVDESFTHAFGTEPRYTLDWRKVSIEGLDIRASRFNSKYDELNTSLKHELSIVESIDAETMADIKQELINTAKRQAERSGR